MKKILIVSIVLGVVLSIMIGFQSIFASLLPDFVFYALGAYIPVLFILLGIYFIILSLIKRNKISLEAVILIVVNGIILCGFVFYVQSRLIVV